MNQQTAKDLGKMAFENGAPRIPALDPALFATFLTGAQVGDKKASKAMRQWLAGWDQANIHGFAPAEIPEARYGV
jgi:hypothetical protein